MEFRILGPLEVASDDGLVEVRGAKCRALLALLLVRANHVVSADRLVEDLWDGTPPESAAATLQTYVSQLRKSLPPESLVTRPAGYVLEVAPTDVDAVRFEDALDEVFDWDDAPAGWVAARLGEALAWWRGPALADFEGAAWAQPEAARLEGLRLAVVERLVDARLALGAHAALVPELENLVAEHPLREGLWAQLMLALYRSDRQADALRTYGRLRRHLGDELGIEPTKELARLEEAILLQKAELDWDASRQAHRTAAETLPSGVVTFLLTDIVGSTSLWEHQPKTMADAVAHHDELIYGAVIAHGGTVLKARGEGDSTFSVFARATDALDAALSAQRALLSEHWPESAPLAVRMALHTGEAFERDGDYYGPTVNRAARMRSLAAGGQVLVSASTVGLVRDNLPEHATLVDLGSHVLSDLARAENISGLAAPDLPEFAALGVEPLESAGGVSVFAPAGGAKGNLPASLDRFVGRKEDLDAIPVLLGKHRLVTLTGAGGSGKTRLALEAVRPLGARHADGVWLVDLASIEDETLIAEATMAALGLRGSGGPARDVLRSHLARRDTLLLVDNCEHVLGGAATLIAELLAACPLLRVVATSREPLRVSGEVEYAVHGLGREEAIELFAERVPGHRRLDDPDAIERICAALEGIPLALELAAAKLRVLSPAGLADRLDDQLAVLVHGRRTAPERQRTLRATLDWSYNLLDDDERTAFRRLGIFAGGFTPNAAEQVVADDGIPGARVIDLLEQLVERSVLTMVPGGSGARFRLLEPVRQYAAERLAEAGERKALAQRHLDWVRHFARQASLEFFVSQHESTVRIHEEHPNICQALEFAIGNRDGVTAAKIIDALGYVWFTAGQPDARLWCERVLAAVPADAPAVTRAGALVATGMIVQGALQHDAAVSLLLEARELYRSAQNVRGEAWALTWLGRDASFRAPGSAEARALLEEALSRYRESDVPASTSACLTQLAQVALDAEDDDLARRRAEEAVQLGRSTHIGQSVGEGLRVLALVDSRAGDFDSADRRLAEVIAIHEAAGDRHMLLTAHAIAAELAASAGDVARAASHLATGLELACEVPSSDRALILIQSAAYVAYMDGRRDDAAVLFGARLGPSGLAFPTRFRPIVEALEKQGLREQIAAGANLSVDEALERAIKAIGPRPSAPA